MLKFISSSVPIAKNFFLVPRFSGEMIGCWPQERRTWLSVAIFWTSFFLIASGACGEIVYGFVHYEYLEKSLEAICPGLTMGVSALKMLIFFLFPQSFRRIELGLKKFLMKDTTAENSKVIQQRSSVGNSFSFLLLSTGCTTGVFFCLNPLATSAYGVWKGKAFSYDLPFKLIIPAILQQMPLYPITYLALCISAFMTDFCFTAVDGFFICACMYISAVFRSLQQDIRQLFDELKSREYATMRQNAKFYRGLSAIVERHNQIIDLCSDFTKQYTLIILFQFLSVSIVLGLSILNLMLNFTSISMFIYLFYSIAALTQLFLYCFGCNYVSESSEEIADVLYEIEWYKCDMRTKKMILMMLRRSLKATTIAVPFVTPSLMAFGSILSTAGSYITLLQTFL